MTTRYHGRSGRPNFGCTSPRAIGGGHERNSGGVCALCGDGPGVPLAFERKPGYTHVTYPTEIRADSEAELYEKIVGRSSVVFGSSKK